MSEKTLTCGLCFRRCVLGEGQTGFCGARKNEDGQNHCLNYGKITALALDPVEKKPLARFYPGRKVLSVGSFGCNLDCPFCQNHEISRAGEEQAEWRLVSPEELAALADSLREKGNIGAAFTYNEPLVGWEYVRDAARLVRARGLKTVAVTSGSANPAVEEQLLPWIDAWNIDLKSFTPEGYRALGGDLDTVLAFIRAAAPRAHVELTALIVPGLNDSPDEMRRLAAWVAGVDPAIPLHITRFFPRFRMSSAAPTELALLHTLADIARQKLDTVLLGNV